MVNEARHEAPRVLGSLHSANGHGVVRVEERYEAGIEQVWSAITDPRRLADWYGHVEGDLRPGGTFRLHVHASGWGGGGRVVVCERPVRLVVTTRESNEADAQGGKKDVPPFDEVIEVSLTPAGDGTGVRIEAAGIPLDKVQFFGVGWQIHAEDLGGHLAGLARVDDKGRWDELLPAYREMATALG